MRENKITLYIYQNNETKIIIECDHFTLCTCGDLVITYYENEIRKEKIIKKEEYNFFGAWGN